VSGGAFTSHELVGLSEIQRLLDEAYANYFAKGDGHCKMAEGHVSVAFGTYFDRKDGLRIRPTSIYSYVLGPGRSHDFDSISEALEAVRGWHKEEMEHDYSQSGWDAL